MGLMALALRQLIGKVTIGEFNIRWREDLIPRQSQHEVTRQDASRTLFPQPVRKGETCNIAAGP
jgi:hypothetical protein